MSSGGVLASDGAWCLSRVTDPWVTGARTLATLKSLSRSMIEVISSSSVASAIFLTDAGSALRNCESSASADTGLGDGSISGGGAGCVGPA